MTIHTDEWDDGDARRAAARDREAEDALSDRETDAARTPYPVDDLGRHMLIVEPDGWTYVAPHLPHRHPISECHRVGAAAAVFLKVVGNRRTASPAPAPGRYWCSVSKDGNFEIGSRVNEQAIA